MVEHITLKLMLKCHIFPCRYALLRESSGLGGRGKLVCVILSRAWLAQLSLGFNFL